MQEQPFHSENQPHYHLCENCSIAKTIPPESIREGTGGKPLCKECDWLRNQNRC